MSSRFYSHLPLFFHMCFALMTHYISYLTEGPLAGQLSVQYKTSTWRLLFPFILCHCTNCHNAMNDRMAIVEAKQLREINLGTKCEAFYREIIIVLRFGFVIYSILHTLQCFHCWTLKTALRSISRINLNSHLSKYLLETETLRKLSNYVQIQMFKICHNVL